MSRGKGNTSEESWLTLGVGRAQERRERQRIMSSNWLEDRGLPDKLRLEEKPRHCPYCSVEVRVDPPLTPFLPITYTFFRMNLTWCPKEKELIDEAPENQTTETISQGQQCRE